MHPIRRWSLRFSLLAAVFAAVPYAWMSLHPPLAAACDDEPYASRGVIKSFGPERKFVNIAHEAIPGYMGAMTMSFEAVSPDQLKPFAVNDRVRFSFTADHDERRLLASIEKQK